ncbi:MAG: chemotaxis protein CheW [Gammaproteobacteria bacterium]|nr:chemotaxis protein CheW [Gammaproteobacteria bacterium]
MAQKDVLKVYLDSLLQEVFPEPDRAGLEPVDLNLRQVLEPSSVEKKELVVERKTVTPSWAQTQFESLLFMAGGLKLSIPLIKSNGILAWNSVRLTPMPGHKLWYLGVMIHQGKHVKIIDVLNFVTPMHYKVKPIKDRLQNIILIDDANWGLACDSIAGTLTLQPDQVQWRTTQSKRPWLCGTAIEQMCALLDPDEFARSLSNNKHEKESIIS